MRSALLLVHAAVAITAAEVRADERILIALVENQGSVELVSRLEAELSAVGFRVERVERRAREDLEMVARRSGAVAALAVRPRDIAIELWGEDPESGATAFTERVPIGAPRGRDISAVAAVEALRGRLLKLGVTPETRASEVKREPPPPPPVPPPAAQKPEREPRRVSFGVFLAGGLGSGADDLVAPYTRLGVHAEPLAPISIALTANWQPLTEAMSAAEGSAAVRFSYITLGVDYTLAERPWTLGIGPGVSWVMAQMEGRASGAYRGRNDEVSSMAALLHGDAALHLLGPLHLRADAELGLAFPRIVIQFAEREVANWGRPLALFSLGADLRL